MSEQQKQIIGTVKPIQELPKREQIKGLYENKQITQTKALIELAYEITDEFFKCDLGIAATITIQDTQRNFLLDDFFSRWLVNQYYLLFQDSPKKKCSSRSHSHALVSRRI